MNDNQNPQSNPVLQHLSDTIQDSLRSYVNIGYFPNRYIIESGEASEMVISVPPLIANAQQNIEELIYIEGGEPRALPELPRLELLIHEEKLTHDQKELIRKRVRDILYLHPFLQDPKGGDLSDIQLSFRHLALIIAMGGEKVSAVPFDNVVLLLTARDMRRLLIKLLASSIEKHYDEEAEDVYVESPHIEVTDHERSLLIMQAPQHASPFFKESVTQFYNS